jgi:hypothetical protein
VDGPIIEASLVSDVVLAILIIVFFVCNHHGNVLGSELLRVLHKLLLVLGELLGKVYCFKPILAAVSIYYWSASLRMKIVGNVFRKLLNESVIRRYN